MQAINFAARPPFYVEALQYCDEHQITDHEAAERIRLSMAHRELLTRMEPWNRMAARVLAVHIPGPRFDQALQALQQQLRQIHQQCARELGLELPPVQ